MEAESLGSCEAGKLKRMVQLIAAVDIDLYRSGRQQQRDRNGYCRRADRQRRRKPDDAGTPRAPGIPFIRHTKSLRRGRKHGQRAESIRAARWSTSGTLTIGKLPANPRFKLAECTRIDGRFTPIQNGRASA